MAMPEDEKALLYTQTLQWRLSAAASDLPKNKLFSTFISLLS